MKNRTLILAALFALIAVIFGAFGAHALKANLDAAQISAYEIGVRYQYYHAMALFIVGILGILATETSFRISRKFLAFASVCFTLGIILFSGSLYLLSCREILGVTSWTWLGPITPLGGLFLIIGWGCVLLSVLRKN
ncbi:MAG: hypothetical protein COA43_10900 [Robiginitomaculum sp.]|nr:MAG: hypothetical protein COA43_10900 [Robiginitomaculum sp.]